MIPFSKLIPNIFKNLPLKLQSRVAGHPVYHRESTHRYFHRPFRERNRKDEEEEEGEEEVKGSRDATSRSRDVYIASTRGSAREREREGGRSEEEGELKGGGDKDGSPLFPVSGLSHRGPYGVSPGGGQYLHITSSRRGDHRR